MKYLTLVFVFCVANSLFAQKIQIGLHANISKSYCQYIESPIDEWQKVNPLSTPSPQIGLRWQINPKMYLSTGLWWQGAGIKTKFTPDYGPSSNNSNEHISRTVLYTPTFPLNIGYNFYTSKNERYRANITAGLSFLVNVPLQGNFGFNGMYADTVFYYDTTEVYSFKTIAPNLGVSFERHFTNRSILGVSIIGQLGTKRQMKETIVYYKYNDLPPTKTSISQKGDLLSLSLYYYFRPFGKKYKIKKTT